MGRAIAKAGYSLVCGGRGGVMEAACRGAVEARSSLDDCLVLGILPGGDRREANPWMDLVVPSGLGLARNVLVVLTADAIVVVNGGSGTLSEIALGWQHGRPIVALTGSGGWADRLAGQPVDAERPGDRVMAARDPEHALALLADRLEDRG